MRGKQENLSDSDSELEYSTNDTDIIEAESMSDGDIDSIVGKDGTEWQKKPMNIRLRRFNENIDDWSLVNQVQLVLLKQQNPIN